MYIAIDKKTKKVIAKGTLKKVAEALNVTECTVREHYIDRDNPNRFRICDYRIEKTNEDK